MVGFLEKIAENSIHAVEKAGDPDYEKALYSLIDTLSVASVGYRVDGRVKRLVDGLGGLGGGEYPVFGEWVRGSELIKSVIINSFSSHTLELDDWLAEGMLHPGASIVPAVIAYGLKETLDLKETLRSIIMGYELASRFGLLFGRRHYHYWHTTSSAGGMAVAGVLTWMMGGSPEDIARSALIAASYSGGLLPVISRFVLSKPLSPAHAAFTGIVSSLLSPLQGRTSRTDQGLEKTICKILRGDCCYRKAVNPPWSLAVRRVGYKVFPSCRNSHTSIQAALKARETLRPEEIENIVLEVFEEAYYVADINYPLTVDEARFSLTFLVALTLVHGWPGLTSITAGLRDKRVRDLERRIAVKVREDFSESFPQKQPVLLTVRTRNGSVLEFYEEIPLGDPGKPLGRKDLYRKERMLAEYAGDDHLMGIIERLFSEDNSIGLEELFSRR